MYIFGGFLRNTSLRGDAFLWKLNMKHLIWSVVDTEQPLKWRYWFTMNVLDNTNGSNSIIILGGRGEFGYLPSCVVLKIPEKLSTINSYRHLLHMNEHYSDTIISVK